MNKSITQDTQNDNQISKTIRRFFFRFHVSSALKSANAYKKKGTPVSEIKHAYKFGFRMLTLGWSDGNTFLPVNGVLLSTENKKNRVNEANLIDKRTVGYKRRQLAMQKGTTVMLELLKQAKQAAIPAKYVFFDS